MSRGLKVGIGVALPVLLVIAVVAYLLFSDDAPPPVDQAGAADVARADQDGGDEEGSPESPGTPAGTWTVLANDSTDDVTAGSFVGYRVQEELAGIGSSEAVGRSGQVTGSMLIEGESVAEIEVMVDMTALESDDSRRDGQMETQALETGEFPDARFVASGPTGIGAFPVEGEVVTVDVEGELTLHGVTRDVTVPLSAEVVGDLLVVTGSFEVIFGDYDIATPRSFAVLSVAGEGTVELQLFFERA